MGYVNEVRIARDPCHLCGGPVKQIFQATLLWGTINHEWRDCILHLRKRLDEMEKKEGL